MEVRSNAKLAYWLAFVVVLAALIWNGAQVLGSAWEDVRQVRESDKILAKLESETSRLQNLIHRYINQPSPELFAEILRDLAKTAAAVPPDDAEHRKALREGALLLARALDASRSRTKEGAAKRSAPSREGELDVSRLTPEEEVLLLHVME